MRRIWLGALLGALALAGCGERPVPIDPKKVPEQIKAIENNPMIPADKKAGLIEQIKKQGGVK